MLHLIKKLVPQPLFGLYHLALAWLGNILYFSPSKKLFLIGVTGTKGKTTTGYFIYQLLEKCAGKTALVSTTFFAISKNIEVNKTKMGMPGRLFLPSFFRRALRADAEYTVLETTSEGIAQHRQRFLDYNVAVFTSLSPEHIERHGGFSAYRAAKEKLFEQCQKTHVLNLNDEHAKYFLKYPAKEKWGVVLDKKIPRFAPQNILEGITTSPNKLKIREWKIIEEKKELISQEDILLSFPGKFNAINLMLSLATGRAAGLSLDKLTKTIPELALPPGRMQEITNIKIPFRVFLDYAHEPLSLKSALEACREQLGSQIAHGSHIVYGRHIARYVPTKAKPKLICLIGAQGGGRDKWKRKVMGATAAKHCDFVIVGTEDPYEEDPDRINQALLEGVVSNKNFREGKNCWKFTDRKEAIRKALSLAKANDIVILTGKGGEKLMCVGNKKIPWDEEEEVRKQILNF